LSSGKYYKEGWYCPVCKFECKTGFGGAPSLCPKCNEGKPRLRLKNKKGELKMSYKCPNCKSIMKCYGVYYFYCVECAKNNAETLYLESSLKEKTIGNLNKWIGEIKKAD